MARHRVKKHTHVSHQKSQPNGTGQAPGKPMDRSPKSMVIRIGGSEIGASVSQLALDLRLVMEPGTASKLKERKSNRLRDYTTMTGPLGVTHLLLFSRSTTGNTNLRLAITPRGPTLHFRVDSYSLCRDILKSQRHPKSSKLLYLNAPLLVMNNFTTLTKPDSDPDPDPEEPQAVPKHLESLVTTVFQSLFPPLSPQSTPLSSIKRVLLLNREPPTDASNGSYTITLRHYAITSKTTGLTKPIRRLTNAEKVANNNERRGRGIPDLGRLKDVAEYLLDPEAGNYTSASESEPDTDAEVEVLAPASKKLSYKPKSNREPTRQSAAGGVEKRAVKLSELGPRMRLSLVKIEEGLCEGKIMWHQYLRKSKEEQEKLEKIWQQRKKEKTERKKQQRENVERKRRGKDAANPAKGAAADNDNDQDEEMNDYEDWDSEDWDDDQHVEDEHMEGHEEEG